MSRFYDALRRTEESGRTNGEGVALVRPGGGRSIEPRDREHGVIGGVLAPSPRGDQLVLETVQRATDEVLPLLRPGVMFAPGYERLIQRLLIYRRRARKNVILVVSAVPREGASTIVRNLAFALAQNQSERVLLVDANLRDPVQHTEFHTSRAEGLVDVLTNEAPLSAVVKAGLGAVPALVPAGSPTSSPSHLLTRPAFYGVISALRTEFDWVLIDGAPLTTYPDSGSLASVAGGAVLVLQAEKTRLEVADEARRILEEAGVDLLGGVLNRRRYHIPGFIYRRL